MDLGGVIIPLVVGFVGAGVGGGIGMYVGQAVLREQVARIINDLKDHKAECTETFKRTVFRDQCDQCGSNGKERHTEVLRRIESLEASFRSCFDDLVHALKQ